MPSLFRAFAYGSATLALTVMVGCSSGDSVDSQPADAPTVSSAESVSASPQSARIRLRAGGEDALLFKADGNEATFEDANGNATLELATTPDASVEVKDASGAAVAVVTVDEGQWTVGNADASGESHVLRWLGNGDYQLETAAGEAIYLIQKRGYGFEVMTPDETSLYTLREKEGERLVLRNAENEVVMVTKDALVPSAMLPFAFDTLSPEQQAGLFYAMYKAGN